MAFAAMLAITTVVLNMTSHYEVISHKKLNISLTESMDLPNLQNVMGWGSLSVIAIVILVSIISAILAYKVCTCCHNMQAKFDDTLKHGKSYLSASFTTCHEENELNFLLRSRGSPSVQTPRMDRELVHGVGDDGLGDDGISLTVDTVDGEIITGFGDSQEEVDQWSIDNEVVTGAGDNQLVDQYSIDDELLLGYGDKGLLAGLVKINSVLKLSDVPPI